MNYKIRFTVFALFELAALYSGFSILFSQQCPEWFRVCSILPFAFMFSLLILGNYLRMLFSRLSIFLIVLLYFFRYVFVPYVMSIGNCSNNIPNYLAEDNMLFASLLMTYEIFSVFLFIRTKVNKLKSDNTQIIVNGGESSYLGINSRWFKIIVFLMISYIVFLVARDASLLRSNFVFLIGMPDDWKQEANYVSLGSGAAGTLGVLVTLMNLVFWFITVFLPPMLVIKIAKKDTLMSKVWLFIIIAAVAIIGTEERFRSIDCSIGLIITIMAIHKKKYNRLMQLTLVSVVIIAFFGLFQKIFAVNADYSAEQLSTLAASYFGSATSLSATIKAKSVLSSFNITKLPADIVSSIPFVGSFLRPYFGETSSLAFNHFITSSVLKSMGLIIPSIGLGYEYFGFLLAPLVPICAVNIAISYDAKARNTQSIVYKNMFNVATIMFCRATCQSNMQQGISALANILMAYFIVRVFLGPYISNRSIQYSDE